MKFKLLLPHTLPSGRTVEAGTFDAPAELEVFFMRRVAEGTAEVLEEPAKKEPTK